MNKLWIMILVGFLFSCIGRHSSDAQKAEIREKVISSKENIGDTLRNDLSKSRIYWKGTKMRGAGMHSGEVGMEKGYFLLNNSEIVGGEFIVDMNTIRVTDIPLTDPIPIKNLTEHLKSDDFFDVKKYPYSDFEILTVKTLSGDSLEISGNLTIKDISRNIQIAALKNNQSFTTTFLIDRFQWNIAYEGSWADRTFVDREMELRVELYW